MDKKTIILGAGLAGLACADELLRKTKGKQEVLVLEKNSYIGGLAATYKKDGFLFDLAPHRWFTKNEELNSWIDELMGDEMVEVKKYTPMYQFGKFFNYPIEVFDVLKKVNIIKTFMMLTTYLWARISKKVFKSKIITMRDAYINRFGYALYKWFCEEYNQKLWGEGGCENMSADWVEQRTRDLSMITVIKNALGFGGKVVSLTPRFRFPRLGIGKITHNLEKRIKKNGGKVLKGVLIRKIIKEKSNYRVVTDKGEFTANNVISSIPLDELVKLLEPKAPPAILGAADKLSYVHQKVVVLFANKPKLTSFTWVYIHPPQVKAFRFLETNNWSKAMSPKGKTSLVFEYPYQPGDKLEKISDKALVEQTITDFIVHFAPETKKTDFIKGYVFSIKKAYPRYDLRYLQPLGKIKKYLKENFGNLQLIGRSGMFRYNNMDHSIFTGQLAARNIIEGKMVYDTGEVNEEAAYLEEKKIK